MNNNKNTNYKKPFVNNHRNFNNNNNFQNQNAYNMHFNNFSNKLNFFNNSFSMNGKQGWICTHCKNFNYESKIFIFYNIY